MTYEAKNPNLTLTLTLTLNLGHLAKIDGVIQPSLERGVPSMRPAARIRELLVTNQFGTPRRSAVEHSESVVLASPAELYLVVTLWRSLWRYSAPWCVHERVM